MIKEILDQIHQYCAFQNISFEQCIELLKDLELKQTYENVPEVNVLGMRELSTRVKRILINHNLKTSIDLHNRNETYYLKLDKFSNKALLELKAAAKAHGFYINPKRGLNYATRPRQHLE